MSKRGVHRLAGHAQTYKGGEKKPAVVTDISVTLARIAARVFWVLYRISARNFPRGLVRIRTGIAFPAAQP